MCRWLALLAAAAVASEHRAASEHLRLEAHREHEAELREGAAPNPGLQHDEVTDVAAKGADAPDNEMSNTVMDVAARGADATGNEMSNTVTDVAAKGADVTGNEMSNTGCDAVFDDVLARNAAGTATQEEVENTCFKFLSKYNMQVPEHQTAPDDWPEDAWGSAPSCIKDAWSALDCEKRLALYEPVTLSEGDALPEYVLKPLINQHDSQMLSEMAKAIIEQMNALHIDHFASFGTLFGAVRAQTFQPWDDDIDFVMCDGKCDQTSAPKQITDGLQLIPAGTTAWCEEEARKKQECKSWKLGSEYILTWKNWGMPWKVSQFDHAFPFVDINTLGKADGDYVEVPEKELKSGHIHAFKHKKSLIFPTRKVAFRLPDGDSVDLSIPAHPEEVLRGDYGDNSVETCMVSHSHSQLCAKSGTLCEHPMANHMPQLIFPCSLWTKTLGPSKATE